MSVQMPRGTQTHSLCVEFVYIGHSLYVKQNFYVLLDDQTTFLSEVRPLLRVVYESLHFICDNI